MITILPPPIALDGNTAIFNDGKGRVVRVNVADVHQLYYVHSGTDLYANDEQWWLIELEKTIIVVPDDVDTNIGLLLETWKKHIDVNQKGHVAVCEVPPLSWRALPFGFLPSTTMKLSIFPREKLRKLDGWKVVEPLRFIL